jgi:hypothetical protein
LLPASLKPNPDSAPQTILYGRLHLADAAHGVSGPLFDSFFLGSTMGRRGSSHQVSVVCQLFGHAMILAYFTALVDRARPDRSGGGARHRRLMLGTSWRVRCWKCPRPDLQYRVWAPRLTPQWRAII